MNCIQIGLPGKLILEKMSSGNHILLKIVSENRFSGKTYFYTIHPCLTIVLLLLNDTIITTVLLLYFTITTIVVPLVFP